VEGWRGGGVEGWRGGGVERDREREGWVDCRRQMVDPIGIWDWVTDARGERYNRKAQHTVHSVNIVSTFGLT
jgi:hypothetical protein